MAFKPRPPAPAPPRIADTEEEAADLRAEVRMLATDDYGLLTDAEIDQCIAANQSPFIRRVSMVVAAADACDLLAERLDPWQGAWYAQRADVLRRHAQRLGTIQT